MMNQIMIKTGIGMSFAFVTITCLANIQNEKTQSSQTVNQPSCHSEHLNDKISRILISVRQCKGCGHHKDQSAFASKGRDRLGALCKDCDNHRRRSTYSPKEVVPDWDQVTIALESAPGLELDTAKVVMELLEEFHLQGRTQQLENSIVDSIIEGGTSLDDLIRS